jgi:hypothetical protein
VPKKRRLLAIRKGLMVCRKRQIFPSSGVEINIAWCSISVETVGVGWEGERKARVNSCYGHRVAAVDKFGCVIGLYGKIEIGTLGCTGKKFDVDREKTNYIYTGCPRRNG